MTPEQLTDVLSRITPSTAATTTFKIDQPVDQVRQILEKCYEAEVLARRGRYDATPEIEGMLTTVSRWLCSARKKPGLMLCGRCGNGKTTMARAVCRLIEVLNLRNVWTMTASAAADLQIKDPERFGRFKTATQIFIDDLGTEPVEIKDFGTVRMPLVDILYHRYETMKFTLCTTNEDDQSLKVKYGERIADRMDEMFNRLAFGAQSFRK